MKAHPKWIVEAAKEYANRVAPNGSDAGDWERIVKMLPDIIARHAPVYQYDETNMRELIVRELSIGKRGPVGGLSRRGHLADRIIALLNLPSFPSERKIEKCERCGGTGTVHPIADETELGQSPDSASYPCPDCAVAHYPISPDQDADKQRIDFFETVVFCAFRLDSGFISIGLPHGVSGSGLTLREAINDLMENQYRYEAEVAGKKEL